MASLQIEFRPANRQDQSSYQKQNNFSQCIQGVSKQKNIMCLEWLIFKMDALYQWRIYCVVGGGGRAPPRRNPSVCTKKSGYCITFGEASEDYAVVPSSGAHSKIVSPFLNVIINSTRCITRDSSLLI